MESGIWNLELLYLALFWSIWCAIHSIMISRGVTTYLKRRFADRFRYYRIVFNVVSVATIIPVLMYSTTLRAGPIFGWSGVWRPVQVVLVLTAIALFYAGSRHYDLAQFLGVRQVTEHESAKGLTRSGALDTSGILGVMRHPWYAAGIIILWARPLNPAALITNTVLTIYLVVGAILEERKLVAEFGEAYREYQGKVPMFVPAKAGKNKK
ncbi:MAG: isoprenylcysteine carboxylmethyltransferase family protein [Pseudomonadota bacterium]